MTSIRGLKRYPLVAVLPGGRVAHWAKWIGDGPRVSTLCRKVGVPTRTEATDMPFCATCANRPNPQDQRSYKP